MRRRPHLTPRFGRLRACLLMAAALLLPEGAAAVTLAGVVEDGQALAASPLHWDRAGWGWLGVTAAGVAGLYQTDVRLRDFVQERRGAVGGRVADWGTAAGHIAVLVPVLAGTNLWARHTADAPLRAASGLSLEAVLFSHLATGALKVSTGRARPELERGSHDFDGPTWGPDTRRSFPSAHTASAFSVATVLARAYPGGLVPYAAYGAALLTGFSRLERDAHWGSDVWMGAATGIWIGHTLSTRHGAGAGPEAALRPLPGGAALRLTWRR